MSKAFTRESDDSGPDEIVPIRPHSSPGSENYITRQGADRLRQQMDELLEKRRAFFSTSSETERNPNLRRIDSQIQKLQWTLSSVIVAEPPTNKEKVAFGASVLVRDSDGEEEKYQIVGVDEADPSAGRISSSSLLARALLNRRAGDTVRFQTPAGDQELTILRVQY